MMAQPLMPKATAVWLVENTALTFEQIADFCELHPLELRAIGDDGHVQSIIGRDPIVAGQLTRRHLAAAVFACVLPSGATAMACSPWMPSNSRLVARTRTLRQ